MAGTIDILKYVLGLDTRELQTGARTAERTVNNMSNQMVTSIGRIATAFGGMYTVHKALQMAKQLGEFALTVTKTAARTEELGVVVANVGKISGYSASYLAQQEQVIQKLGITTQASRMLLIRFMQSQLDVAKAAKIARAAQDFAVIGMMDSSEAAKMLTFAISAQRPRLLRQFGIVTDLAEVFRKYGKTVGKSAEDLTEHEKRMSFYNVIMENASRITGTYESAMETAGKRMRSIPRYCQEAANAVGKIFMPMFREMVDDVTQGFKDVEKAVTENQEAVKKWQAALVAGYKPVHISMELFKKAIGGVIDHIAILKKALFDLPLDAVKKMLGIKAPEIKLEVLYDYPRPPNRADVDKVVEPLATALLDQMLWKLDLDRKYEKITLAQYKTHLQNILTAYKLTEEQRIGIKKKITEIEYQIEADMVKNYEAKLKEWNKTYAKWIKDRTEKIKEIEENKYAWLYEHEQISAEQYVTFLNWKLEKFEEYSDEWIAIMQNIEGIKDDAAAKDEERWAKQIATQEEMLDVLLTGYDSFFSSLINRNLSVTEALKLAWQDLTKAMLGYGFDLLKQDIKNALLRKTTEAGVQKSMLAAVASGTAARIAWMAKEGAAALMAAAKSIYSAVAKIFEAHAWIPFVGVAIAGAFVGAMMASIGKFKKFAEGGLVGGLLAGQDQLLAALTKGEFVIPKPAVQRIGVPALEHMRRTGEVPSRRGGNVYIDMGGFTFNGTKREDAYLIENFVEDKIVEVIEEKLKDRELVL